MTRAIAAVAVLALVGLGLLVGPALLDGEADSSPSPSAQTLTPTDEAKATSTPSPSAAPTKGPPPSRAAAMPSDFNGDGFADLAVGVPNGHARAGDRGVGAVYVLPGSSTGLTAEGSQLWTRDSPEVLGITSRFDDFGSAVASGDFDSDGYADLAIGAPDIGCGGDSGSVTVLYGSPAGLTSAANELWLAPDLPGVPDQGPCGGGLGQALTSGDFDGDGFADLAIGHPGADPLTDIGYGDGLVAVLQGSADGLVWRGLALPGSVNNGAMGWALAAGDLNGDGRDDLAAGATLVDMSGGAVAVYYGSDAGLNPLSESWTQDSGGILGESTSGDDFGWTLAIGDFERDGFEDLAVGVPGEGSKRRPLRLDPGAVNVIHGSANGLTAEGNQLWDERPEDVPGNQEDADRFGDTLAAGDFDGDGADDLAIGAPDIGFGGDSGSVTVLYGSGDGLSTDRVRRWTQDSRGVEHGRAPRELRLQPVQRTVRRVCARRPRDRRST